MDILPADTAGSLPTPPAAGEAPGLPSDPEARAALLLRWAAGNHAAAAFLTAHADAIRLTDDVADGDRLPDVPGMARLWGFLPVQMALNPWVRQHAETLGVLMAVAGMSWEASEEWRRGPYASAVTGFVRRDDVDLMVVAVALLTGGPDHARRVMRESHEIGPARRTETVADWIAEAR